MELILGLSSWVIIAFLVIAYRRRIQIQPPDKKVYRYLLRTDIMTTTEKEFYKLLENVVGGHYKVFPQVRLSTLLNEKVKGQSWKYALWSINQKSVDFVVCNVDTLQAVAAIELDDYTHDREDRIKRDENVEKLFASVNFPLLRFRVGVSEQEVSSVIYGIMVDKSDKSPRQTTSPTIALE